MPVYSYQMRHGLESQIPGNPPVLDYEPFITTDSKELWIGLSGATGGAITPSFNDSDLTTASGTTSGPMDHMGRPATTKWVQTLLAISSSTPPSGVAWRTQPNTFIDNNIFEKTPTITAPLLPATDSTQKIPTTEWVQLAITNGVNGLGNVAYKDKTNTFSEVNTFNSTVDFNSFTNFNGATTARGTLDFTQAQWNRVKTRLQTEEPSFEAANTEYVWDSMLNDVRYKKSLTPPADSNDTHVATTAWVKANASGASLLPLNNTWTGTNTFNISPLTVTPPLTDNSNKIPTTEWVRGAINSLMTGGGPVLTKSMVSNEYNKLLWSSGMISINGVKYTVNAGNYTFPNTATASTSGTTYYVKAELANGQVTIPVPTQSSTIGANQVLLGTLTLTNVMGNEPTGIASDPDREISGVINAPPDYARRDVDNVFLGDNTFNGSLLTVGSNTTALFKGITQGDYIIPIGSSDKTLANTEWVKQVVADAGDSYFELDTATGNLIPKQGSWFTGCLDLSDKCLLSSTPLDTKVSDNTVATTQWVHSLLSGLPTFPLVTLVGTPTTTSFKVTWTEGQVDLPIGKNCSGNDCKDGGGTGGVDRCVTSPPTSPMTIPMPTIGTTAIRYIYVDYDTCQVLHDTTEPDNDVVGKVIAVAHIDNSANPPTVAINQITTDTWAPINSPFFTGEPKAPTPQKGDCDNSIATTAFVCEAIEDMVMGACGNTANYPEIYNDGIPSLLVNVTNGSVPKPDGTKCNVSTLATPIALVANTSEYCWIRFSDCKLVASTNPPTAEQGFLLAIVVTGATSVISITKTPNVLTETKITTCYKVGFGGRIFYVPDECCK